LGYGKRPTGVSIIAVLQGVEGILLLVGGALLILAAVASTAPPVHLLFLTVSALIYGSLILVIGLICFGVAYGLWVGNAAAWGFDLITALFAIVTSLFDLPVGIIELLLGLIIFGYLLSGGPRKYVFG